MNTRVILEPFGNHVFTQPNARYWVEFDWKAAVLFWCSDLQVIELAPRNFSPAVWQVVTPGGRPIINTSLGESAAWCLALAEIFKHLNAERNRKGKSR